MAWPETKKRRCISEIKRRLKQHKPMKALRLVSDVEQVPVKTLQEWWYAWQRQEKATQKVTKPPVGRVADSPVESDRQHSLVSPSPPPDPPPHLLTDGELRCSRCKGKSIESKMDSYHCSICGVLVFEGWPEEKTVPYFPYGSDSWML